MLKNDISMNARTISYLLADKGAMNLIEMKELTGYEDVGIALALGWLAKENSIRFMNRDYQLIVESLNRFTEIYY